MTTVYQPTKAVATTPVEQATQVLAVSAPKGGVGKTTTVLYLAHNLSRAWDSTAERPLVGIIDREHSRNLSRSVRAGYIALHPGVVILPDEDVLSAPPGLRLILIDTPPGIEAISSLMEANLVLIPVIPEILSMVEFKDYLKELDRSSIVSSSSLRLVAALPTKVERTVEHRENLTDVVAIAARRRPPLTVLSPIPKRASIAKFEMDSPEYVALTKELLEHGHLD